MLDSPILEVKVSRLQKKTMGNASKKKARLYELEERNQTIQEENVELRRLRWISEENKHGMQKQLQDL